MLRNPREELQRYLDRHTGDRGSAAASIDPGPLPMHRGRTLVLMVLALLGVEWWVWTLIGPWFSRTVGQALGPRVISTAGAGFLISVLALTVFIAVAVRLFTDVDNRGIRRPDWAGGDFIPWSSVTQVYSGRSPEELHVRAGDKRITLNLMLFQNPAAVVALIRRQVPAERLRDI